MKSAQKAYTDQIDQNMLVKNDTSATISIQIW